MSEAKKAGALPSSALSQLIGLDSSGNCAKRTLSDARRELWEALFTARSIIELDTIDTKIPPGYWAIGSLTDKGTMPDTAHNWSYGLLKAANNASGEQFQFLTSYYGGRAYRAISTSGVPKRWIITSEEKF